MMVCSLQRSRLQKLRASCVPRKNGGITISAFSNDTIGKLPMVLHTVPLILSVKQEAVNTNF